MKQKDELKTTIYEANYRSKIGWIKTWIILIRNVRDSRELIYQLFKKDFLMRFKKSFLGMGWIIISPIMGIISWVLMNATGVLNPGDVGIPYPAYVLISTTIYGLFMSFYKGAAGTLNTGKAFIMQVSFHRDALLFKQALQQFVNFLITFVIALIVLIIFGVKISWMLVLFPFLIIPMFLLASSIGLIVSLVQIVLPDITKAVNFAMGLFLFITPVIYSSSINDEILQTLMKWNPLTYLFGTVRDSIIYGKIEHFDYFLYSSAGALVLFLISWRLFYISEEKVIEKMI